MDEPRRADHPGAIGAQPQSCAASAPGHPLADVGTACDRLRHLVAHKLARIRARIAELQALDQELESLDVRLLLAPGPDCAHLGDCGCWLPTDEDVKTMTNRSRVPRKTPLLQLRMQSCDCPDCPCNQATR